LFLLGGQQASKFRDYWTLLELRPANFFGLASSVAGSLRAKIDVLHAALVVTEAVVASLIFNWQNIYDYFDQLIGEKDTFLSPGRHDNLLSDDETFSRSKKYFWSITTLKELTLSISDNLLQIKMLLDTRAPASAEDSRKVEFKEARSRLRLRYQELEELAIKLREKRQEALDLRDGVCFRSLLYKLNPG
jgi:hypothetical protein